MQRALNMLETPAALFEFPSRIGVCWNAAAEREMPDGRMSQLVTDTVIQSVTAADDRHLVIPMEIGEVHFSVIDPPPTMARPALLLATVHRLGRTLGASLHHEQVATTVVMNEAIDDAEAHFQTTMQALHASMASLRAAQNVFNVQAAWSLQEVFTVGVDTPSKA